MPRETTRRAPRMRTNKWNQFLAISCFLV
jgi:hypothetical protein